MDIYPFMDELRIFLGNKRNIISLLGMGIIILALPLIISLVQQQLTVRSRATVVPITFTGENVQTKTDGTKAFTLDKDGNPKVGLQIVSPFGQAAPTAVPTAAPTAVPTAAPTGSGTITASPNPTANGSTTITWNAGGDGQVYVSIDGAADILVWQNKTGTEVAPWIQSGSSYEFRLYQGTLHQTVIGRVTVTRQ